MRRVVSLAVGGLVVAMAGLASAQSTQIKPRVLLMVDTSGSMNFHLNDNTSTGGDGSDLFSSAATYVGAGGTFLRSQAATPGYSLYEGFETSATKTCNPQVGPFDGVNSRMFAAKSAISDVINGSGDIDWGLMRYNGSYCNFSTTFTVTTCRNSTCTGSATCSSNNNTNGFCQCTNDGQCAEGEFCLNPTGGTLAGRCGKDANLCNVSSNLYTGMTDTRSKTTCSNKAGNGSSANNGAIAQTYAGGCGTSPGAGNAVCATPHSCNTNADCGGGGNCVDSGLGVKWCACGTRGGTCNNPWGTCGANNWCLYSSDCVGTDGGFVLIDPNAAGFSSNQVLPWINGAEIYTDKGGTGTIDSRVTDPELHANGGTPLAGAARAATQWYVNIRDGLNGEAVDSKLACRPYVLIQLTDGEDSCDADTGNGPVAAAAGFVGATKPGAKNPNKVYVIGLATTAADVTELNTIAQAGGTGAARFATSKQDIEAALADIVASSVLVEKCNGIDDNCNGQCDENFPGVSVSAGVQTCTGSGQCGAGQTCNAQSHCTCTVDTDCVTGYICSGGVCASCSNPHAASTCDNGQLGQCFATGTFVCSADQLSQVCSTPVCTAKTGATVSSPVAGTMRLSNTSGVVAGNIGQIMFVSGSTKVANNGGFLISGVPNATTVDLANTGVVVPDSSSVTYAIPSTQGKGTTAAAGGNVTITVTAGSTVGLSAGATIFVLGGAAAGNNGQFTISNVTATTITYGNAGGVSGNTVTWAIDICKGVETCNGLDDDCDGIIDNCGGTTPGTCCTSNCPACAQAPFIETCNNCDDDCDGVIDNHLVDTGLACGNNVGDCLGGTTVCCNNATAGNPATCVTDGLTDHIVCKGGNPPYPTPGADVCDGTDDNCNGVANDGPPVACFTDGTNTLPPAKDGVGVCHHGIEACQTLPFCGTSGVTPPNCIAGACPPGWPSNKTCPNPTPAYGACQGLVAPSTEFCDGLDNDCNNCKDDNPQDSWINTQCCGANGGNPLTDCDNTGGSNHCARGTWQCKQPAMCQGGTKTCVGSTAKSVEICNGIDDDCNGIVDDVPGVGAPCTGPGIFTGGECTAVMKCVTSGQPPQCVQVIGPVMETCNGKDDNCNGQIDDNGPPLAVNPLPGVGVACDAPMPPADKPPCKPGTTVCQAGQIVCVGAVGPMPNQCNGISTDCTGNPNTNGNCPTGFQCYQGNCVAPCQAGEFPCPGGYACNMQTNACDMNGMHNGCCVPDACANLTCPPGFTCQLDAQGNASCVDPCLSVTCPPSYVCKAGACVDGSCRTQGCPDPNDVCVATGNNMFECQPDPCANVMCEGNQFCQNGTCVSTCSGPCPKAQYCDNGQCVPDPCAHTPCVEGQVCRVENGVGVCVENQCQFGCNIGQACCGGECVADQCENLHCPEDTHCTLTPDCQATCETNPASPKDQVVGAGGGGFGCAVAGQASDSSSLLWLLVVAGALLFRRRRTAEVRK